MKYNALIHFNLGVKIDLEIFSKRQFIYFSLHCKELCIL